MALTSPLTFAFLAVCGAFFYRVRGGFLGTGSTQLARVMWAVPTGLLLGYLSNLEEVMWSSMVLGFAALLTPHGRWMDMGRYHDGFLFDAAMMALVGAARFAVTLGLLWLHLDPGYLGWFVASAGLASAASYSVGLWLPISRSGALLDDPTAWGELLWGASQWGLIWAIFIAH